MTFAKKKRGPNEGIITDKYCGGKHRPGRSCVKKNTKRNCSRNMKKGPIGIHGSKYLGGFCRVRGFATYV